MAKLVGTYKFVVASVDVGRTKNKNDVIKLGLQLTDERLNDQDIPLQSQPVVPWFGSLKRDKAKNGKTIIEMTLEKLKRAFKFSGGLSDLHNLILCQGYCICPDHEDGNFTRVSEIYGLEGIPKGYGAALEELSSDVASDLDAIFKQVTSR